VNDSIFETLALPDSRMLECCYDLMRAEEISWHGQLAPLPREFHVL
jgi:hypothetical protein